MVQEKSEVAAREHLGEKVVHDGFHLDVEVAKHFVRAPSSKAADTVRVHIGAKESHCASCLERPGRDILGKKTV